jgi:hypothetical protein
MIYYFLYSKIGIDIRIVDDIYSVPEDYKIFSQKVIQNYSDE